VGGGILRIRLGGQGGPLLLGRSAEQPYVRPSEDDPELDARVKRARKRVFISSRVLTSEAAIAELEEWRRTKTQRRAARGHRVVVDTIPA
jgi:hypothetical protein